MSELSEEMGVRVGRTEESIHESPPLDLVRVTRRAPGAGVMRVEKRLVARVDDENAHSRPFALLPRALVRGRAAESHRCPPH